MTRQGHIVDFGINRKHVYDILWSSLRSSNTGPILPHFRDIRAFVRRKPLFP